METTKDAGLTLFDGTIDLSGITTTSCQLSYALIPIDRIENLQTELDALKAENAELKSWLRMGAYSAK